jgi:hypothetical protein
MRETFESSEILFVKKSDISDEVLSDSLVVSLFNRSDSIEEIKTIVEKAGGRFYASWSSVDVRDNSGEIIPINDVIDGQVTLLKRGGSITDNHTNAIVGRTHAYKVLEHPIAKKIGVLQLNQIYTDNPHDDMVWNEIINGTRKGSSVGGTKSSEKMVVGDDGLMTKQLLGFNQYETASVYDPANPFALNEAFSIVAKSGDDFKEKNGDVNMTSKEVRKEDVKPAPTAKQPVDKVVKQDVKKEDGENIVEEESSDSTEFDMVNAIKEMSEKMAGFDERMNEIEDKISGAPDSEDEEKADEESDVKDEESDMKDEDAEKSEEEDEPEPKEEVKEVEKADVLKSLKEENESLKAEVAKLTPAGVVKTDRPAEKEVGNSNKIQDIMKKIQTGNFDWNKTVKEMKNL